MSFWRQLTRGLRVLGDRKSADQDVADQVDQYLDEATAAQLATGLSPEEARRAARMELGSLTAVRERVRGYGWENAVDTFFADLRYAVRRLRQRPGFAAASLLTMALGIGATSAMFTVIDGVLLRPLPYPQSEQIVALRHTAPGLGIEDMNLSASLYFTYSEESRVFQDVGMYSTDTASVTGLAEPEEMPALVVTNRFLPVLGVQPVLGRAFLPADDDPTSERVVILSDGYWRSRFGGERSVLGRRMMLDGRPHRVIGVMPPSFQFMDRPVSLLLPLRLNRANIYLVSFCCQGIARLKPSVTLPQANADVSRMLQMAPAKFAVNPGFAANVWQSARFAPRVVLLKDYMVGDVGKTLWVLLGTVGLILLIASANVANLLLVRADGRSHELAVRAALGAGRGRIARELLLESLVLALVGGGIGLGIAGGAVRLLAASGIRHLPRVHDISMDAGSIAFTMSISLLAGLFLGLIPVLKYARPQLSDGLRAGGGRSFTGSKERNRARSVLVVVQVALALVLLIGSGLMIRTFQALRHVDPGFSGAEQVETVRISIPESQVQEPERAIRMEEEILRKIESVAGISSAAIVSWIPLDGGQNDPVYAEDHAASQTGSVPPIQRFKFVSPGYFSTVGAHLMAGRDLTWAEIYGQTPVALVSANMAREWWGSPSAAIGKRIRPTLQDDWREIIGVVADLHDDGIDQKAPGIVYWPILQRNFESSAIYVFRSVAIVIRTPRAGSAALFQDLQNAVASVNPNLPLADVKTLQTVYDHSLSRTSFTLVLLAIAGGMALFLGAVGIYGVISYSVSQRTREVGIRLALGATLRDVTVVFVRYGVVLSGIGAACGLIAALALSRLMKALLYEVSPVDPLTYAAVAAALIVAGALASYLPARRAAKVDPSEALRAE